MSSDGVDVDIIGVNLEIYPARKLVDPRFDICDRRCLPIESESLNQSKHTFAEKRIDTKGSSRLEKNGKNGVAENLARHQSQSIFD